MTETPTDESFELGGHRWTLVRIGDKDAFEAEALTVYLLGPSCSEVIASLLEGLASEIVTLARSITTTPIKGEGDDAPAFDLARLLTLRNADTSDPRVQAIWLAFTEKASAVLGQALASAIPQLTDRAVDHTKVVRLFELHVLGSCFVHRDKVSKVNDWRALAALTAGDMTIKYNLLGRAILLHWLNPDGFFARRAKARAAKLAAPLTATEVVGGES